MEMMRSRILRSLFFLSLLYLPSAAAWNKTIYVSPSGNDSQSCGHWVKPCKSLDAAFTIAFNGDGSANSTLISAAKGNYTLIKSFNFTNVDTFALVGNGSRSDEVRITCEPDVSLSFILCQNIALEGLTLLRCGGWRESTVGINKSARARQTHQGVKFKTALDFRYCRNTRFTNIEISSSPGLGVNFFDVGGVVNFTDCVLADNRAVFNKSSNGSLQGFIEEGYMYSGGGIYMILNKYGDNVVNVTPSQHDSFQHNNTYVFRNCYFLRNKAFGNVSRKYDHIDDPGPTQFSLGGGVAINFRGNASNCNTEIESCVFRGNQAVWGGGLQVETRDEVKNNHFTIKNTSFYDNTGLLGGGGVRMGDLRQRGAGHPLNTFTFDNSCTFVNNSAFWGGGMSLYGTSILCKMNCDIKHITQFTFNKCTWSDNIGTVGAGIATMLQNQNEVQIGPEMPFSIIFKDCSFSRNQVVKLDKGVMIGEGAIYSDQVPLIFRRKTSFISNTGTALSLDGSTIEIYDHVDFINNTGYLGGAVAMRGQSRMIFQKNSKLLFNGNSCERLGGALFIHAAGSPLVEFNATGVDTQECFFGYEDEKIDFNDWKTSVIFQGNRAMDDDKGNSVYATTLVNCRRPGESRRNNTVLQWDFIQFRTLDGNNSTRKNEVATDAIDISYVETDWEVAPGELFNATVKLIDEIGNSVIGIIDVNIVSPETSVKLNTSSTLFLTSDGQISYLRLAGKPGSLFSVSLRYVGRQLLVGTITDISLQNCHPGFFSDGSTCDCMDSVDDGVERCKSDGKTIYLKKGYWAGKVKDEFVTYLCPAAYCNFTKPMFPDEYQYISGEVCKDDRDQTSVLCGQCKPGYTVSFGSENCKSNCKDREWAWPVIVVGLVIVNCLVLSFSPNLASGHLNACLYSYQMMKIITPEGFKYDPVIEFLAALSNFQLGIGDGFCLAGGLNNADKLMIMIIFPVVEIVILAPVVKAVLVLPLWRLVLEKIKYKFQCNPDNPGDPDHPGNPGTCCCRNQYLTYINCCSESFNERVRKGFTRALCTIIVLCYVDIIHISLRLLHPATVGKRRVLFADGNMEFFGSTKHIGYGICAAGLLMLCVIVFPIVLIFYPSRKSRHLTTLRACYKTRLHPFIAYYLGCRVVLLVISTYVPAGPLKGALLQFFCILFLFVIAVIRPYKERNEAGEAQGLAIQGGNEAGEAQRVANQGGNEAEEAGEETVENKWTNKSDAVILTTLSAIAVLSSPIDSDVSDSTRSGLMVAVRILAWVPLLMALLPYALRYLPGCCKARDNHVPEPQRQRAPNDLNERTPLLCGIQQQGVPDEGGPNVNQSTPPLGGAQQRVANEPAGPADPQENADEFDTTDTDEFFATAPEQQDVSNGPDGDLHLKLRTPVGADNDGTHQSKSVIV